MRKLTAGLFQSVDGVVESPNLWQFDSFDAALIDSLTLMVHPVIAGRGRRLFEPEDPTTSLTLQDTQYTSKGNAILSYGVWGNAPSPHQVGAANH